MKKIISYMLSALVVLLYPALCMAQEEPHPEITLIDYDGNEISLDSNVKRLYLRGNKGRFTGRPFAKIATWIYFLR